MPWQVFMAHACSTAFCWADGYHIYICNSMYIYKTHKCFRTPSLFKPLGAGIYCWGGWLTLCSCTPGTYLKVSCTVELLHSGHCPDILWRAIKSTYMQTNSPRIAPTWWMNPNCACMRTIEKRWRPLPTLKIDQKVVRLWPALHSDHYAQIWL